MILILPFVASAPPVSTIQQFPQGYAIIGTPTEYIKQGENFTYNFFLHNISNGAKLTDSGISCKFYVADSQGNLIVYSDPIYTSEGYFNINVHGNNFSKLGYYPFGVNCNSSSLGGIFVGYLQVTSNGFPTNSNLAIFFSLLFLILLGSMSYMIITSIGHAVSLDFDIKDLAINYGIFFAVVGYYYLQNIYFMDIFVSGFMEWVIYIGVLTNLFLPTIYFIITLTIGSWLAKRVKGVDF